MIDDVIFSNEERMTKTVSSLKEGFATLRTGRASLLT
jgi:ribosome recycling factor